MLKLFQGEEINNIKIPSNLTRILKHSKKLQAVGYYYSPATGYVLMLPNAFKKQRDAIVDDWELLVSVHFMLERYVRDSEGKSKDKDHRFQMPERGQTREDSFLDVLIRIRNFFRRNSSFFFTHIARSLQPQGAIDWSATVSRGKEVVVNNGSDIFYPDPVYTRPDIDVDHKLFILFLSIVRFIKKYGCKIAIDLDLELLPDKEIEGLCASKRGCRLLKSIRDMYFSDIAIEMWQLCYDFFDRNVDIRDDGNEEYFYTMSFNMVFEKMIDTVIADPVASKLYSSAWARIDHVFEGPDPIIPDSRTLYVLDSKCYEEYENTTTQEIRSNLHSDSDSAHKQKAYIDKIYGDAAKKGGKTASGILLLDYNNESHRFIPNCFIVPANDEMEDHLTTKKESGQMIDHYNYWHWTHRPLFGITTKYIFVFHIDLKNLMSVYSSNDMIGCTMLRNDFRKRIHDQIHDFLYEQYDFNTSASPKNGEHFLNTIAVYKQLK